MEPTYLIPEQTVESNGESSSLEIAAGSQFLVTLNVTRVVEQEALEVTLWASADGADWGAKPVLSFPQKFYTGTHQLLLNLAEQPQAKFLKAKWTATRWGRGALTPNFTFSVSLEPAAGQAVA